MCLFFCLFFFFGDFFFDGTFDGINVRCLSRGYGISVRCLTRGYGISTVSLTRGYEKVAYSEYGRSGSGVGLEGSDEVPEVLERGVCNP